MFSAKSGLQPSIIDFLALNAGRWASRPTAIAGARSGGRPKVPAVLSEVYSIILRRSARSSLVRGTCQDRL